MLLLPLVTAAPLFEEEQPETIESAKSVDLYQSEMSKTTMHLSSDGEEAHNDSSNITSGRRSIVKIGEEALLNY